MLNHIGITIIDKLEITVLLAGLFAIVTFI